jgi:type IV pilus assembly protein PilB
MEFLQHLSRLGIISKDVLDSYITELNEKYKGDTETFLIEKSLTVEQILRLKSDFYGIPARHVEPTSISFDVLKYIPEESARYYKCVPIGVSDNVLEVGIVDPGNIEANDALQFIVAKLGISFVYFLISQENFNAIFKNYDNVSGNVDEALTEFQTQNLVSIDDPSILRKQKKGEEVTGEEKIVEDAPIIKIVSSILRDAVTKDASDIHIENTGKDVRVRFRLDGSLLTVLTLPLNVSSGVIARIKILGKLRLDEKRKPQDGGFSAQINSRKIDFRLSTFPTYYGEKVVMRILDAEKGVKSLDQLSLRQPTLDAIKIALDKPYGIILITGPTGSGKSTTLFSMLNEIDRDTENVVSLEDPVEYHMPGVSQSQVQTDIGYTFAAGLRSILRQDPDVIMVGEIRDAETASLAIQAALTGHIVFSTLHTNTATGAIPRLIDMGVDPYLIAPTLSLALGQRLVRTFAPGPKKELPIDESTRILITKQFADLPEEVRKLIPLDAPCTYEPIPTKEFPSGMKGRMAVMEALTIDKDLERVILKNPVEPDIFKLARSKGMTTLREDALIKALSGLTTLQEAYGV